MYLIGQKENQEQFRAGQRVVVDAGSEPELTGIIWEFKEFKNLGWMALLFSDPGPTIVVSVERISKPEEKEAA